MKTESLENMKAKQLFLALVLSITLGACHHAQQTIEPKSGVATAMRVPDWAKNATMYEMNVSSFSKEGTFAKATEALPRIKDLGVSIIWLMPIYPISLTNRKCDEKATTECLGSPYAADDFKAVNPRLGTNADFRAFVQKAHQLGLKVILDFVPDHTGWDSKWMKTHPEYFVHINGKMTAPIDPATKIATDWADVAMLDYQNPALRTAVIDAHQYWLREFDVDGFREDVASYIPNDFWMELRPQLDKIKPVYMLSESDNMPEQLVSCFQMNYGWRYHNMIKDIFKGRKNANAISDYLAMLKTKYAQGGYQMLFTQNHDENSWQGTERESFGDAGNTFTALSFTLQGMGLIYNGQEASLNKRLAFFNKDAIDWTGASRVEFFRNLNTLKHTNQAVWNGADGGDVKRIETNDDTKLFAFTREKNGDKVLCIYNLSPNAQDVTLKGNSFAGMYKNVMKNGEAFEAKADQKLSLNAWEYVVLSSK